MLLARLLTLLLLGVASGLTLPLARTCSRRAVAATAAASLTFLRKAPARANDADDVAKKFEKCVSLCVYDETKIAKGEHSCHPSFSREAAKKGLSRLAQDTHPSPRAQASARSKWSPAQMPF